MRTAESKKAHPAAPVLFWHYDQYPLPPRNGAPHPYPRQRFSLVREALLGQGHLPAAWLHPARPVEWEVLERVHTPAYVQAVREEKLTDREIREIGLPFSSALVDRSRAAVGATVQAALMVREARRGQRGGWLAAGVIGGGTHHASAHKGAGYCLFNDIAVAIQTLRLEAPGADNGGPPAPRVMIIDLDVHQGNGNAEIFSNDRSVFTLSAHGEKNWPYRKAVSDLDLPLPDGLDDEGYLAGVMPALEKALAAFGPELVFYQAGVDALASDRLGRLNLSHTGLHQRDRAVFALCQKAGADVVLTMGGGYGRPIEESVQAHLNTVEALLAAAARQQPSAGAEPARTLAGSASGAG